MGEFLIVGRGPGQKDQIALRNDLRARATAEGFTLADLNAQAWLAVRGPHPPRVVAVADWTLIGDVFDRWRPTIPAVPASDPLSYERKLISRFWGRFVGIQFHADRSLRAVLRDPSGAFECVAWDQDDLTIISSSVQDWLIRRLRPGWRIDPNRVAEAVRDPIPVTGRLMLIGPTALEPGTLQPFPLDRQAEVLWSPIDHARRSLGPVPSVEEAAASLRSAVDETVKGFAGLPGRSAAEVSGGLDSSIIAASLVHAGARPSLWLNAFGSTAESDERTYVDALARTLSIRTTTVPHATAPMTTAWLEGMSPDFRPGLNAMDLPHDLDWADRLGKAGVNSLFTGKGGDSVLFNRATSDVFIDAWRRSRREALTSADTFELAASNEVSLWTLIARARDHARTGTTYPRRSHPMLPPLPGPSPSHPWTRGWDAFGPAKAMHIASLADNVARHGPSALSRTVDLRNPLCAQPVIEACLALPTSVLTTGGRERGLARLTFTDRLPAEIVDRRSKGDMTKIYGRMILEGLDVLRPWLLEGRLAALGVIDRAEAEAGLTREALVWRGRYSTIMVAAAFESWVRSWEKRLAA
jgi:asparagine synthase (glutamine-hydrolysing)